MGGLGLGWDAIQVSMKLFCFLDISLNGLSHISTLTTILPQKFKS